MRTLSLLATLLAATLAVSSSGCAKRTAGRVPAKVAASAVATAPAPASASTDPAEPRAPRFRETAVYVDGVQKGILRIQELPASFKPRTETYGSGSVSTNYYFVDYAKMLGLDLKKLRAAHFHGGSRVSIVDQAELARIGHELAFTYTRDDGGKPRMEWPSKKLHVSTLIDMLSAVAFYVEKEPPHLLADGLTLVMPDGSEVGENIPYTNPEQGTGTRVYVDGVLLDTVKRKRLTNDLLAGGGLEVGETSKFSLDAYARKVGVDPRKAKAVDMVAGDAVIARLPAAKTAAVTFGVPRHNRGHAMVDVPTKDGSRPARVSAIQFFVKSTPPSRAFTSIDDAPEAQQPSGDRASKGSSGASDDE